MINNEEIITKLKELNFQTNEIDGVISDVTQIIIAKSFAIYLSGLPEAERLKLQDIPVEKIPEYFQNQGNSEPKLSEEEFSKIYDQTWGDYFHSFSR